MYLKQLVCMSFKLAAFRCIFQNLTEVLDKLLIMIYGRFYKFPVYITDQGDFAHQFTWCIIKKCTN